MKNLLYLILLSAIVSCNSRNANQIQSPNGKIQVRYGVNDVSEMYYSVISEDSVIIEKSSIGISD